jgi:hypothetical protein
MVQSAETLQQAARYRKPHPTFPDRLALVRREPWAEGTFCRSVREVDMVRGPRVFLERLTDTA